MTRGISLDLSELFAQPRGQQRESAPASPPDVVCITLREVADRYAASCPFQPGNLVTPRKGYGYRGAGNPHVVLEVRADASPDLRVPPDVSEISSNAFGTRLDVRVACETEGQITAFWQESWRLELYRGPGSSEQAAS